MFFQIQIWFRMNCDVFFGLHIPHLLDWFCTAFNIFFFSASHSILRFLWYWCSSGLIVWSVLFSSIIMCIWYWCSFSFRPLLIAFVDLFHIHLNLIPSKASIHNTNGENSQGKFKHVSSPQNFEKKIKNI